MISEREMDGNAEGPRHPETGALLIGEELAMHALPPPDRMLRLFAFEHLQRADLRALSMQFSDFAHRLVDAIPSGPERTVALRKLLEAKDAAIRAVAIPEIPPLS